MINRAHRPVIQVGGGVIASASEAEVLELAAKADMPIVSTLMGLGAVPDSEPHYFGLLGMHGSYAANKCVAEADLVLTLGARFSDRVALKPEAFAKEAKVLQIDIDKSEIGKNVAVAEAIVGDCKQVLQALLPHIEKAQHADWLEQIEAWQTEHPTQIRDAHGMLNPQEIIACMCAHDADKETIFVTDVGQHQMWAAQYVKQTKPRNFLTSGGLGTMGFGMGAANGACIGTGRKTVLFTGDGSFAMNFNELGTAVTEGLPVIVVLMDNGVLGMVRQLQRFFSNGHYSQTTTNRKTDFVAFARAMGAEGYRATTTEEMADAMQKAKAAEGPVVIACEIDREDMVYPMVPSNQSIDEMILQGGR